MKEFGSFLSSGKNSFINAFLSNGGFTPSRTEVEEGDGGGRGKEENATPLRVRVGWRGCGGDGPTKRIELGGEGGMEAEGGHGRGWRGKTSTEKFLQMKGTDGSPSFGGPGSSRMLRAVWRRRPSRVGGQWRRPRGRGLLLYYN
ncbi:unnamed protein product [Musa banksii]